MTLLFLCYVTIVVGWYQGTVVWWLALATVGASIRTLSAVGQLRRYKAWLAEWSAMGGKEDAAPPPRNKPAGRRTVTCIAVLLLLVIPSWTRHIQGNEGFRSALILFWFASLIYLVGLVLRCMVRWIKKRTVVQLPTGGAAESAIPTVEWMLGPASSSPSRAEAERQLPEYCIRLLSDSGSVAKSEK
jgi:hypothetical protein